MSMSHLAFVTRKFGQKYKCLILSLLKSGLFLCFYVTVRTLIFSSDKCEYCYFVFCFEYLPSSLNITETTNEKHHIANILKEV